MRRVAASLVLVAGLVTAAAAAHADCVSACQAATYCDSEMHASGECGRLLNECYINQCNKKTYGSIAYGANSGAYGWSNDFDDATSPESEALNKCGAAGDDCQVVVDFWNSCAAVASDDDHVEYGLGENRSLAENAALSACGSQCSVQAWACTGP